MLKLGLFSAYYEDMSLEECCEFAAGLGYEAVELACWHDSAHLDAERAVADAAYARSVRDTVARHGLEIACVSNHLDGQLVLGPHDRSTDGWAPVSGAEEKIAFGTERAKLAARAANALEVSCVAGFVGSHVWGHWYNHDPEMVALYEEGWDLFAERWNPILDVYREQGVRFAHEVHPVEIAYNIETAVRALEALDRRPEFGFNFDPSHFVWQSIDPSLFAIELGERIFHVHAKDTELVAREAVLPTIGISPEVDNVVFGLPVGAISDPIATGDGTVIARVNERDEVTPDELRVGKEAFRAELLNERRMRFFTAYMNKAKAKLSVEINQEVLRRITAAQTSS